MEAKGIVQSILIIFLLCENLVAKSHGIDDALERGVIGIEVVFRRDTDKKD
jgi:hypothetical protein